MYPIELFNEWNGPSFSMSEIHVNKKCMRGVASSILVSVTCASEQFVDGTIYESVCFDWSFPLIIGFIWLWFFSFILIFVFSWRIWIYISNFISLWNEKTKKFQFYSIHRNWCRKSLPPSIEIWFYYEHGANGVPCIIRRCVNVIIYFFMAANHLKLFTRKEEL